jgi:hypothetical protein
MDKGELLRREEEAWARLQAAIAQVPEGRRTEPGVVPGWSVQDLVWHCGKWADYVAGELEAIASGGPQDGDHDDAYWDGLNEAIAQEARTMTWADVMAGATGMRERARGALEAMAEIPEEAAQEFSDETFAHYEEHAAEIASFAGS